MKKNKLYTISRYNRPAFMPHADYTTYDLGGIINGVTDKLGGVFGGSKLASTPGGSLVGALGTAVGGVANKVLSGGLNSGAGNAVANIGGTVGGLISNVNPLLGGIVSAGTGIIGGGINALFGTKVDKEKLAAVNSDIARGRNFVSKAGTFEDIKGPEAFMTDTNVYSGGLLVGGNARRKNAALRKDLADAALFAERSVDNNINNIWGDMVNDALYNYSAFGGPLDSYSGALGLMQNDKYIDAINNRSDAIMGKNNTLSNPQNYFGDGGGIHIKKANEGKFTAQANRAGMGVQEYASHVLANKEDYPASTVKRANFARNAAKWHAFGGELGTNGTDWTNGLLYVDAGGTHQQNPLGGVPVGFDQNGTPNLVEEGETIWNDYVFSNRIKVPKAMFHTLGLGGAMKKNSLTFADASKKLAKESEQRPNDPISMAGLEASLSKLAAVQEAERMKKQMRQSVGLENMAAYGGPLGNVFAGPGDRANIIKSIPKNVNRAYPGQIEAWLRDNYIDLEEEDIRDIAQNVYRDYSRAEREKEFLEDAGVSDASALSNIERVGMQMALDRPFEIGPIYSQTLSELKQRPIFDLSESNFEEHIRKAMRAGMSFDEAWRFVDADRMKGDERTKARRKERMRKDLENDLKINPSSNTETVTDSSENVPAQQPEQLEAQAALSTNPELKWGIQNAMQEAARQEAERNYLAGLTPSERDTFNSMPSSQRQEVLRQVSQGITAGNTSSGTGYTGTPGVRGQNGIIPYGYYTNGSDGLGEPTGFTVGKNGLIDTQNGYTQEYRDLVKKLTADDIRKWVEAHPNDPSYLSFKNRGNDINKLTDEQWRTGALDGKYGFMHHVADSILKGDYTPASGEPQIMSAEEEEAARNNAAMQPSSNLPQPTRANGETNPGVDLGDRTSPVNDKRPLLDASLRYAPAIGGAIGVFGDLLGLTNKPDYTYADRLEAAANAAGYAPQVGYKPNGDYERYTPFDRLFYANQLQANARGTDRMLANTSSPSRAAGLLANAYNTNNALGNLYRQGDEYNLAQYQQVKDFNRRTNMFNSQMGLEADIANARYRQMAKNYQMEGLGRAAALRDAIDQRVGAARSANLTNFFNSLGNIGRENFTFNQINQDPTRSYIYQTPINGDWGYVPKFMQDAYQKDVESAAQRMMEEERKKNAETQKATQSASGAYGGKLKRNKK